MKHTRRVPQHVAAIVAAMTLAAHAAAAIHVVQVASFSFAPQNITVAPGDTVRWVWVNGSHTVTSGTGCSPTATFFDRAMNSANPQFDWVVPTGVGFVPYVCRPHCSMMTGTITIRSGVTENYTITLDGDQEGPTPVPTVANGAGTATLDLVTNLFEWNITFAGLQSAQTAAHFHGPALPCANAGVVITLPNGSPIVGSQSLTATQAQQVREGRWYVNVHTSGNPTGEIRGQVMPVEVPNPVPALIPQGDLRIRLRTIATGLTAPNWGTAAPGDSANLFVGDQAGTLWKVNLSSGAKSVFLDVASRLVPLGVFGPDSFDERGFLGVAFHPNYQANGKLYTFTSEPVSGPADFSTQPLGVPANCQSVVAEWTVPNPGSPGATVDPNTRRTLLKLDKPQFNHNGGALVFGPDGLLYISTGDGGGADDRDGENFIGVKMVGHACAGNGQNTNVALGKILRIDPLGNNSANGQYGIPPTNPFVGQPGLDEIYAYGLRNPWRIAFDGSNLWAPDVGQNAIEEINVVTAPGANLGWRAKEGTFKFVFNGNAPGYVTDSATLSIPAGLQDPIAQYDHDDGTAIVGGFVYRGASHPDMFGRFICGDFAQTFNNDGRLFYLDAGNTIREFVITHAATFGRSLLGFGIDANGEVYALANSTGTPFGNTGVVLRLASPAGDMDCDGDVDFFDIDPLVLAFSGEAAYLAQYPNCYWLNGDTDHDHDVDFFDIDPFIALLGS